MNLLRRFLLCAVFACGVLGGVGCGDSAPGFSVDADLDVGPEVLGPNGESGFCCPLTTELASCRSRGYTGGWAAQGDPCVYLTGNEDGYHQYTEAVDDYGCRIAVQGVICGDFDGGMP